MTTEGKMILTLNSFSSLYSFDFNGIMKTHMIENYTHYVFAFEFNHVDFILIIRIGQFVRIDFKCILSNLRKITVEWF